MLRANDSVKRDLLALERHLDVDHAADLQRGERAALERDEHAFGADVADRGRKLLAAQIDPGVDAALLAHGHAEGYALLLLGCHGAAV